MSQAQTVHQLNLALDLLSRRQKALRFIAHCLSTTCRHEANLELSVVEARIAAIRRNLLLTGA